MCWKILFLINLFLYYLIYFDLCDVILFNHYKGSLLELNLLNLALEISLYSFYDLFIVIVTDGNVTRSDVNDTILDIIRL